MSQEQTRLENSSEGQLGPRDVALELLRAQLESDARRRSATTDAYKARMRVAKHAGIPGVDIQRRSGVARQTMYDAIARPIGDELDDLAVLALIASGQAQTPDTIQGVTGSRQARVIGSLSRLVAAGYVSALEERSGADLLSTAFTLTAKGLERLRMELETERLRGGDHADCWVLFLALPQELVDDVLRAAELLLGADLSYGLVGAHVAPSRMSGPELALAVRAPDSRDALVVASGIWTQIRQSVPELSPAPQVAGWAAPRG